MADSLAPTFEEGEDISAAETFEELCRMCEKGLHEHVTETMISNPLAESTWINQRRERDLATPIFIAASWGHSDTVAILLHSGANPHLRGIIQPGNVVVIYLCVWHSMFFTKEAFSRWLPTFLGYCSNILIVDVHQTPHA